MRIMDIDLDKTSIVDFIWTKKTKTKYGVKKHFINMWSMRYKNSKRELGKVKYIETNAKDGTGYYQGFVTINKLSGDFHFKEEDFEVAKFKVYIKLIEKFKEMQLSEKERYYEIY